MTVGIRYFIMALPIVAMACASPSASATAAEAPSNNRAAATTVGQSSPSPPSALAAAIASSAAQPDKQRDAATIFTKLKPDLIRCYEEGKKATPTMLDGRLTLNASMGTDGKATCVVPTLDTGLTQEVEDCMSARFGDATFGSSPAPWAISVPIALRNGAIELGVSNTSSAAAPADSIGMDSVETTRMANAFEVIESLEPEIATCMHGTDRNTLGVRSFLVAARVATDGRNQCALTSTPSGVALPAKITDCLITLLRRTKFPPPKGGPGLVLIPIHLVR